MNRSILKSTVILLVATLAIITPSAAVDRAAGTSVDTLVKGNTAFAVKLYRELGSSEGNLFFSPLSISSALGMTYAEPVRIRQRR